MNSLEDLYVVQGDSLIYQFEENVNFYGQKTNVTLQMTEASMFASYNETQHAFVVDGTLILDEQVRMHKITAQVIYLDPKG